VELFIQHERDAVEKATALRSCGLTVEMTSLAGGHALAISGPESAMREVYREIEKGYGRITGDDGYIYFCHFSDVQKDGYRNLLPGRRVEFERVEGMGDHGRAGATNVRVIEGAT
jgi:cold shock CspA family protein